MIRDHLPVSYIWFDKVRFEDSLAFASELDKADSLRVFRTKFYIPTKNGKETIYLCGNSLGLQPKNVKSYIDQELKDWSELGVDAHFEGINPWFDYHQWFSAPLAELVGAKPDEVSAMGQLTFNLHLLLVSFYKPIGNRTKIIYEATAFPSDRYALESQVRFHGLNPDECLIALTTDAENACLRTDQILEAIYDHGDELALVMLGGVNYFTGQFFDLKKITAAAHAVGAIAGFDLAHAIGNVPLSLHDWNIDFACWCSYKYLNSGPGGVAGIYVHEKYGDGTGLPRFNGWWGTDPQKRFTMSHTFIPAKGADSWQLSNAPVFNMIAHRASLEIFREAGFENLRNKSVLLTGYLEFLLGKINAKHASGILTILTPSNPNERGCQLSVRFLNRGRELFEAMQKACIVPDWRNPDVIRMSPVPLYNTFTDVWHTADFIRKYYEG